MDHICTESIDNTICSYHRKPVNFCFDKRRMFLFEKVESEEDEFQVRLYSIDLLELDKPWDNIQPIDDKLYTLVQEMPAPETKLVDIPSSELILVKKLMDQHQCFICKNISRIPHRCSNCNQLFCCLCISNYLNFEKDYCPSCFCDAEHVRKFEVKEQYMRFTIFMTVTRNLVLKCRNHEFGCLCVNRYNLLNNKLYTEHSKMCDKCPDCLRKCEFCH